MVEKNGEKKKYEGLNNGESFLSERTSNNASPVDENECETPIATYQEDSYSFISVHVPLESPFFFALGLFVFLFQMTFLSLMCLNTLIPSLRSDISDDGTYPFIPANVEPLVKATQ